MAAQNPLGFDGTQMARKASKFKIICVASDTATAAAAAASKVMNRRWSASY
jgi:hypothetical protein